MGKLESIREAYRLYQAVNEQGSGSLGFGGIMSVMDGAARRLLRSDSLEGKKVALEDMANSARECIEVYRRIDFDKYPQDSEILPYITGLLLMKDELGGLLAAIEKEDASQDMSSIDAGLQVIRALSAAFNPTMGAYETILRTNEDPSRKKI